MLVGLRSAVEPLRVLAGAAVAALLVSAALRAPPAQAGAEAGSSDWQAKTFVASCPDGTQHEKLTCDSRIKLSKCFDAEITCGKWYVKDCCSPIALHKCLSPLAGRAFGADCSSPIDAREECCADPITHRRSFQKLAELEALTKEAASKTVRAHAPRPFLPMSSHSRPSRALRRSLLTPSSYTFSIARSRVRRVPP